MESPQNRTLERKAHAGSQKQGPPADPSLSGPRPRSPLPLDPDRSPRERESPAPPPPAPAAAKRSFSTSHKKRRDGFRPWQSGVPFLALQAKTVKAKRKI